MNLGFVGSEQEWRQFRTALPATSDVLIESPTLDLEALLADPRNEAVVLAGPVEVRAERLRLILQTGRSCLCSVPADLSSLAYHEAALLAADAKLALVPFLPGRLHPAWHEFLTVCRTGSLGAWRDVLIERTGPLPPGRQLLAESYAQTADLLGSIVGEVTEITTTGDATAGRVVVHHRTTKELSCEVRLTSAAAGPDRWRVAVKGGRGSAELVLADGLVGPAVLRCTSDAGAHEHHVAPPGAEHSIIEQFRRALAGEPHAITWSDAIRAAELADCAWISLERRRSVDVYHEKRNELASFKGRMTSLGCGLIWVTVAVLFLIAAGDGLHIPGTGWVAAGLVLAWMLFVGLQALRWVLPTDHRILTTEEPRRPTRITLLLVLFVVMFFLWVLTYSLTRLLNSERNAQWRESLGRDDSVYRGF